MSEDFGESLGILDALVRETGVASDPFLCVVVGFAMSGEVDDPVGRDGQVDHVGHDLLGQVAEHIVGFDASPHIDGLNVGVAFLFGEGFVVLFVELDPVFEIFDGLVGLHECVVQSMDLNLFDVLVDDQLVVADGLHHDQLVIVFHFHLQPLGESLPSLPCRVRAIQNHDFALRLVDEGYQVGDGC